jgi:hypothetical protein
MLSLLATQQLEIDELKLKLSISRFGLERYSTDKDILKFYSGFTNYEVLVKFFEWLAPAARQMAYPYSQRVVGSSLTSRRLLVICDELFLTLSRLHGS